MRGAKKEDGALSAAENPFRADRIEALRYRDGPGVDELLRRLHDFRGRGALVGPKGSGKTTLVLEIAARLRELGWKAPVVRLDMKWRRSGATLVDHFSRAAVEEGIASEDRADVFRSDADHDAKVVWFLDGAEQLGFLDWRWALSRTRLADGFVVTTHLPGRFSILKETRTSPELLFGLVVELVAGSTKVFAGPTLEECRTLWIGHNGNLRECFHELYDEWSRLK
jgi:hypothetical protein